MGEHGHDDENLVGASVVREDKVRETMVMMMMMVVVGLWESMDTTMRIS